MGADTRQQAFSAIEHATHEFLDQLDRLGAEFHGDEAATRALVRFQENVDYAQSRLGQELGYPPEFDDREERHLHVVP